MMEPIVSIIVPIYKAEEVIKRCVESIRNQSYTRLEIILVDDGSPDSCGIFCDHIAKKDGRIIVVHKQNEGVSAARNTGIQVANGKYVQFVDSDDYISTDYISRQVAKIEENNADILICGYVSIKNDEMEIRNLIEKKYESLIEFHHEFLNLYNGWFINAVWNKMFRRELIQCNFNESMSVGEDLLFNLDYLKKCKRILLSDITGYYYTVAQNLSLARIYDIKRIELVIFLHNRVVEFCNQLGDYLNNEIIQDKVFATQIRLYIVNLIRVNSISKHDKIEIINHAIHNKIVINGFKVPGLKKEELLLKHLMKFKNGRLLYEILKRIIKH
jgi:glycosyltransferase involved in cell wall biosynthesis